MNNTRFGCDARPGERPPSTCTPSKIEFGFRKIVVGAGQGAQFEMSLPSHDSQEALRTNQLPLEINGAWK
jgi:hypothetical protein